MSFIAIAIAGTPIAASIAGALGTTAATVGTVGATALTTGVTTGITKGIKGVKNKVDNNTMEKNNFKRSFSSKNPAKGYGGASMTGNSNKGPDSIGSVIGIIAKGALKLGKLAIENPEITRGIVGSAVAAGSLLKKNRQNEQTTEAPSMMGYSPVSKHMGGRGASMYGGQPMMNGEDRKAKRAAKKDMKSLASEKTITPMPTAQIKPIKSIYGPTGQEIRLGHLEEKEGGLITNGQPLKDIVAWAGRSPVFKDTSPAAGERHFEYWTKKRHKQDGTMAGYYQGKANSLDKDLNRKDAEGKPVMTQSLKDHYNNPDLKMYYRLSKASKEFPVK